MKTAIENGRCMMALAILPNNTVLQIYNIYGWVNAHLDHQAAVRTSHLVGLIKQECQAQGKPPTMRLSMKSDARFSANSYLKRLAILMMHA